LKTLVITTLTLMLSACQGGRTLSVTHPYALDTTPPPGSTMFQKGYTDGCESAMSGMGNQFIKVFHSFQYDASLANDKVYTRMWDASNNYCRLFLFVYDENVNSEEFKQYDKPVWFWK
jgi:hypothetical protein